MRPSRVASIVLALSAFALLPACDLLFSAAECQEDSDCSGDDVCDDGTCVECDSDSDCDDNEECDDGDCEAISEGEGEGGEGEGEGGEGEGEGGEGEGEFGIACSSTSDCPIDDFCNSASFECEPLPNGVCRLQSQCNPDELCAGSENVPGQCVECLSDDDCPGGTCDLSFGVCEAGDCDVSGFDDPAGDGLVASDATLDPDDIDNIAECTFADEAYLIVFALDDTSIQDPAAGDVRWTLSGGALQLCATPPVAFDGIVICPVCFGAPQGIDLAVQYDDGIQVSNAVCVDTSGV